MASKKKKRSYKGLERHGLKWRWRRTIDGESVRVSFSAPSLEDAIAQVLEFEKHPHLFIAASWERELDKHLEDILSQKLITKTYADTRKRIITLAGKDIGIKHPRHIDEDKINKWLLAVKTRTSDSTRNTYLTHLRKFCEWLKDNNRIYINPCEGIKRIRADFIPRNNFITRTEVRAVIDSAKAKKDLELELILILACECGMRKGEISAARNEWLDLQQGTITVPAMEKDESWSRKGKVGRKKSVTIEMVTELREYFLKNGVESPFLIRPLQSWGKWKYRYDFEKKVRRHLTECGHPDITIHDLRRSFGSNRIIAGRTLEQVSYWMGIHPHTAWKYYARFKPVTGDIEHGSAALTSKHKKIKKTSPTKQLKKLKKLLAAQLITKEEHEKKRGEIIKNL